MSVQMLNQVHRRYIRASNHFKSAWTFQQFAHGLRKTFGLSFDSPEPRPDEFQEVYADLKRVSQNLAETTVRDADQQLDEIARRLGQLVQFLIALDGEVSPGTVRQFFQRVKSHDDKILSQLVKFYLYSRQDEPWAHQQLDKADYLVTKLCETFSDPHESFMLRDRTHVREVAQGLWAALARAEPSETALEERRSEIAALRGEIELVESMDGLHEARLVPRYRDLKHSLGDQYFHPRLLPDILAANLALKNHVHRLYQREEQRIVAEYQQVFELERDVPIGVQLGEELSDFRQTVERFEQQLAGDDLKLDQVVELRRQVRDLVPKLRPGSAAHAGDQLDHRGRSDAIAPAAVEERSGAGVAEQRQAIVAALDDTNATIDAAKIALLPEIFSLGIGPREVTAYRRLYGDLPCDRVFESFLLDGAALRVRVEQDVAEIKGLLDESKHDRNSAVFQTARATCRRADRVLREYSHRLEQCVLEGDSVEAAAVQRLRMRMMRAYSGLWLMIHR
ncbi:MAG: hypothetical protein AAGN46_00030 [Acidobacteriota bacterium]